MKFLSSLLFVGCLLYNAARTYQQAKFEAYLYIPFNRCRDGLNYTYFDHIDNPDHSHYFSIGTAALHFNHRMRIEGDVINFFYTPGNWPRIVYKEDSGGNSYKDYFCGGIPQKCHLQYHVQKVREMFQKKHKLTQNLGIIVANHWRPIYRQNVRWDRIIYQVESINNELKDPKNNESEIIPERARLSFEKAGMEFFKATLDEARSQRKNASWGVLGVPSCFNKFTTHGTCSINSMHDNLRLSPIIHASTALFPAAFFPDPSSYQDEFHDTTVFVNNLIDETFRVAQVNLPRKKIIVVVKTRYSNNRFPVSYNDFLTSVAVPCEKGADAVLIYMDKKDTANCEETWKTFKEIIEKALISERMLNCRTEHWHRKEF